MYCFVMNRHDYCTCLKVENCAILCVAYCHKNRTFLCCCVRSTFILDLMLQDSDFSMLSESEREENFEENTRGSISQRGRPRGRARGRGRAREEHQWLKKEGNKALAGVVM